MRNEVTALVIFNVLISFLFISSMLDRSSIEASMASPPKAAIIDQVSLTYPNRTFIQTATNILEQAGYSVDYYPGEEVTVMFYKKIPLYGYRLILFRVHSSLTKPDTAEGPVNFFTSEPYDEAKYINLQLTNQLVRAAYTKDDLKRGVTYFAVNPNFVTKSMAGRFKNTTIIAMGCDSLNDTLMAKAFVEKGASIYAGWSLPVTANETDTATIHLLQHLLIEKATMEQSVRRTYNEAGINNNLTYYPLEAGEQKIEEK